ncbi:MAG: aminotransferase class V-fold PLP-dependent enzyme [Xanthomonadales bacterium]|nr:aminotransferase class V-fold PLP-dependent enzyme [Xanthomonadales bacterium]
MRPELQLAAELADEYLSGLGTRSLGQTSDPEALRERLQKPLTEEGVDGQQVIQELFDDALPGLLNTADGRFFGWVIGGTLPTAIAADWLVSAWDQSSAAFCSSPSTAVIEDITGAWLKDILGLPSEASFGFVTGCQAAHITSLAAARHRVLAAKGWMVEEQGLFGAPPIRVLVGEHHETLLRALRFLGLGTACVRHIELEADGSISLPALDKELRREPDMATIVSLAAGELNRGAFDPIAEVCERAHRHDAWVHVDGAFGLWAAASPRFRHLLRGYSAADSWATDAHKWLNVPYDCGVAFVKDAEAHKAAMAIPAAYKLEFEGVRDQVDWNPEWSRRARSVPVYAALRTLGRAGVAKIVESCCDRASELVDALAQLPDVEVLAKPLINQGLVRFLDPNGNHDARTDAVIQRVVDGGNVWFGPTTWQGKRVMRISVSNYRTSAEDVALAVATIERALQD